MLNPKICYNLSKKGWYIATNVDLTTLQESLFIESLLKDYGKIVCFPGFINEFDKNLAIFLDGDVYIAKEQYSVYYNGFKKHLKKFGHHIFNVIYRCVRIFFKEAKKISLYKNFSNLNNEKFLNLFNQFVIDFSKVGATIDVPFMTDYALSKLLKEEFCKQNLKEKQIEKIIFELCQPKKISYVAKEKKDLEKILEVIRKNQELKSIILKNNFEQIIKKLLSKHKATLDKIKKHQKKYAWLGMRFFCGKPLSNEYFIKRIKENLVSKKEQKPTLVELPDFIFTSKIKSLVKALQEICYLRTWRIEKTTQSLYYIFPLLEKIANNFGLQYNDLIYLTHQEIIALLQEKGFNYNQRIKERKKGFGMVVDKEFQVHIITGCMLRQFKKYFTQQIISKGKTEIIGSSAYPGIVKGIVKIINNAKEFIKFKKMIF